MKSSKDQVKVTKIKPIRCPQCQSTEVKAGFGKRVGRAWVRDGKIWCFQCKQVTDTKTGKVKKHEYSVNCIEVTV